MNDRLRLATLASAAAALAALAALGGSALAADPPHDPTRLTNVCADCHIAHQAPGSGLTKQAGNANLCISCHTLQAEPTLNSWAASDQATSTTGSSHRWSNAAIAPDKGAQRPTAAALVRGLADGTDLQCSTCHDQHMQQNAPFDPTAPTTGSAGRHFLLATNAGGQMCADCHAPWVQGSTATGTHVTAGTATFASGSATVTGQSTTWLGTVQPGWRIKALSHPASAWAVVLTVNSNTSITLVSAYAGASASTASYVAAKALSHPVGDLAPMTLSSTVRGTPLDTTGAAQIAGVWGTATGGTTTTLVDNTKAFVAGALVGLNVRFTRGANRSTTRAITANTATQITFAALPSAIAAGTTYEIDRDGNLTNNLALVSGGKASFTGGNVVCQSCHGIHFADSDKSTFDDRPRAGNGKLLRRSTAETCDGCHPSSMMHNSTTTGSSRTAWGTTFTCVTCHQPHGTGNLYLVRNTITTPNSGDRDVDFRAMGANGVESYGLANATTPGTGPCETCHTDTRNGGELTGATSSFTAGATSVTLSSTAGIATGWEVKRTADPRGAWTKVSSITNATTLVLVAGGYKGTTGTGAWQAANPRFRNTGSGRGAAGTEHYVTACIGCHPHKDGFAGAGESNGGSACDGCHNDLTSRMTLASGGNTLGGKAIVSRHQVQLFTAADSNVTWGSPLNTNLPANRSCVNMCHGDHPHDLTSPVVATHEYNANLDATDQTSRGGTTRTSATRTKTDFDNAATNGGMCLSCHRNPVDANNPVQHPAVSKTAYASSAHNYFQFSASGVPTTTWTYVQHDGGVFQRNCTKCHAERADGRPSDSGVPFEAVHYSSNPSLLAGNVNPAAPGNVVAENVCYNCHGDGTNGQNLSGKNLYGEVTSAFGHPVNSDSKHSTPTEAAATANNGAFSGTNRHVNCVDCHDPHQAQPIAVGTTAGAITAYAAGTDYSAGTASVSRNQTAVTGTGTAWTASMIGMGFRSSADTATWYAITAVASATSLTISPAAGSNLSGAYIIRGGNTDTLTDGTKAWTKNQFKGWTLKLVSGAQAGRTSAIYGSGTTTGTQLLVKFPSAPAVGDRYVITPSGARVATGSMPSGSPAMAGAWGVQPTFGTPPSPPSWNDSNGCGAADAANSCEVITAQYGTNTFTKTTANPPPEAFVCIKCHSSFAYGTTLANYPNSLSGQPNAAVDVWSNTAGAAMRQSDISSDANPNNIGHHAIFAKGRNQPMVSSGSVSSVRNPNWPLFTSGTVGVASTTVTLTGATWPVTLVPGWFIYLGNAAPANPSTGWYEVTAVTSDTVLTIDRACASPSTCSTSGVAYALTAGLGNTFVPPWGPWSVLECSDCHRSSTLSDPFGPHGSATKWMLRGADTQTFLGSLSTAIKSFYVSNVPTDANNICLNCHRRDVYGDFTFVPTPRTPVAGDVYTFSRQNHPADKDNGSSAAYRTRWGIECMNCHGGARQGAIHGLNLGRGNGQTATISYSGRRLLAGSSWYAVTRSSTTNAGACWTKGNTDAVDNCGHAHAGDAFESGAANYDYESTASPGTTP